MFAYLSNVADSGFLGLCETTGGRVMVEAGQMFGRASPRRGLAPAASSALSIRRRDVFKLHVIEIV